MANIKVGAQAVLGLTLDPDANGNATDILPTVPTWSVSDTTVATITQSEDGRTAILAGVGAGVVQVTVVSGNLSDTVTCTVEEVPVPGVTTGIHIVFLPDVA
jgi:hypothetical protein